MSEINYEVHSRFNDSYSTIARRILSILSENARASISDIAKETKISRKTVSDRIKEMERKLGLKYTIELDERALGLSNPHLTLVDFKTKPDYGKIAEQLSEFHVPQLAVSIKGSNSMLIYGVGISTSDYVYWDNSMQILLAEYGYNWQASEVVHMQLGFFPLRDKIIDKFRIAPRYAQMLKLLNENSRISFNKLAERMGMHFNTVAYNFNKLQKMGYIKRFTITLDKPDDVTLAAFFTKYTPRKDFDRRTLIDRRAILSDDELPIISRYPICAPMIGTYDHFGIGAFDDFKTANEHIAKYRRQSLGNNIKKVICLPLDKVLIGRLPLRSINDRKAYNAIDWTVDMERLK